MGKFFTYITATTLGIVLLYFVAIPFLAGGGLVAAFNLGKVFSEIVKIMSQVPIWVWLAIAFFWLLSQMRK